MNVSLTSSRTALGVRGSRLMSRCVRGAMVAIPLAALTVFFLYPLVVAAFHSLADRDGHIGLANYVALWQTPGMIQSAWHSIVLSVATTIVSIVLGFMIAFALYRSQLPSPNAIRATLLLPMLAPSLMQGLGILFLLGRNGLVHKWTGWDVEIYGFWGLLIADVIYALPQAVLIIGAALAQSDARYYDAADVLGATRRQQFFGLTLPNAKFGLLSAAFVVFTVTITDFGNAVVIGGDYHVLATEIYNQVSGQMNFGVGAAVGIVLLLPSLASVYIERVASQRQFGAASESRVQVIPRVNRMRDVLLGLGCFAALFPVVASVATVVFASFVRLWPYRLELTLANYSGELSGGYGAILTSLEISVAAAALGVCLLFSLSYGARRVPAAVSRLIYTASVLPAAVPGMVVGLAYILAFNSGPLGAWLYGSATIIVLCNFYHYHTQGFLTMSTGMRAVPVALEEVVDCLGGGLGQVLKDAVLPFVAATAISVFFFLFMRSMVTLSAVVFLVTPSLNLASVAVMQLDENGFVSQAAAYSTCIMAVTSIALGLMRLCAKHVTRSR
ncbi:ABC transporter permease subunit [Paraburkholderia caballeronis]|uniref:Iron(III) transport system permease protein n=1 Tax=Paraburkholderia caballeronis TaxID=416943 RepID=A0A1H7MTF6_9BURK|nr:ABC transporter permease subunit [Paraburkholderia caballeronis]PXW26434.1 iron(III) transport system permease protein [Paraburkholderia caballeronis]PXX01981.1 iron(III) transport system permease protein [Paraburkholderia caballeronis]RAK01138.1 iron(III) transport system permease protein [Paraburkholderia caballeronis]SEB95875.1 iron(III) transport system permease protein [Paraburkholderia caballeronis]SEL14339.1 iron(III) transport system permease protein [Paraburkholderia caballeronis]